MTKNPISTEITLTEGITADFEGKEFNSTRTSRKESLVAFHKIGLPGARSEEYRFTPVTRYLEKNFRSGDFSKVVSSSISSVQNYLIPGFECNVAVFINGKFAPAFSSIKSSTQELTVLSLNEALADSHPLVEQYFSKLIGPEQDPFAALNTALWQDGLFIHVPDNTAVDKPLFILHLHDAGHEAVISQTRVVGVIGKGSTLQILEKSDTKGSNPVFDSVVNELTVLENGTLTYHVIQNDHAKIFQNNTTCIHQHASSRVNTLTLTLDGDLIRNNLHILVDGEKCESHFYGLYLLNNNTLADNHTVVDHRQPNSYSNELYKGIMDGHSKGVFNGKIYVRPYAQKTNAFQSNRNILLSDTSTINTKPQLEIWADDVKCSHGCTSGQLDEEALFYLQSRGISKHTARAMVLNAFAGEILEPVADPVLKSYLNTLVTERLEKNL